MLRANCSFIFTVNKNNLAMSRLPFLLWPLISLTISSCNSSSENAKTEASGPSTAKADLVDGHPDWIMQGNIYEVNVRQYTPEGTFKAFEQNLDRLKEMGVQTLWFMPINPIR